MIPALFGSRKWTIGCLYVVGIFACDLAKVPLSTDALFWSGWVVSILIGGQHGQEMLKIHKGAPL